MIHVFPWQTGSILDKNQEEQCKKDVEKYLTSTCEELNVEPSLTYIQYCFKLLKNKINSQNTENKEKQLEYVNSQRTLSALRNTIDKQDQEISILFFIWIYIIIYSLFFYFS